MRQVINICFLNGYSIHKYYSLGYAIRQGQSPVVELFLNEFNFNAATNENEAIRLASMKGYTNIVRMLLKRPEVKLRLR